MKAPLKRVEVLLQAQDVIPELRGKKYTSAYDCMSRIYSEQGFKAFWRGNIGRLFTKLPNTPVSIFTKDLIEDANPFK